jgi:hypothetical protein
VARIPVKMTGEQWRRHQALRAKVKKHLQHRPTVPLKDQRDYYEKMAADDTIPKPEREQWQMLADDLTKRIGDRTNPDDQPPLF